MGFWGRCCRFVFVDFILPVRNIRGSRSSVSVFFEVDTWVFGGSFGVTRGTRVATIRSRKSPLEISGVRYRYERV